MTQPLHTLVTHAGSFHSDEIMAVALLERFYLARPVAQVDLDSAALLRLLAQGDRPEASVRRLPDGTEDARTPHLLVRTRAPDVLAAAKSDPTVFVLDVGGELEPTLLNFDHHQASMQEAWPDGTPFSSTGLVWRWLRGQGLLDAMDAAVLDELEASLIRPLDAHDNGQALCPLAQVCEGYNRHVDEPGIQLEQFDKAKAFLADALANHLHQAEVKVEARQTLAQAWATAQARGDRHVVLGEALAYPDGTGLLDEVSGGEAELLAIPGRGNRYSIISLPIDGRFSIKCPVPEAWRGRMDQEIEVDGRPLRLAFAHKTGFMCVVQGGPQDAHRAARHIVAHNQVAPRARRAAAP